VRKTPLAIAALSVASIALSILPAQAVDSPGLIPTGNWNAGVSTVTVGLEAPMTGVFAVLGISQKNSLTIVADQINKAGGIGGAQIKIKVLDDGLSPVAAVANAKEFASDPSVQFVVGPSITSFYQAAAPAYEAAQKPNCAPAVAAGNFADYKYGFRSQDYYKDDINAMFAELQKRHITTIGLVLEAGATGAFYDAYMTSSAGSYGIIYLGWQQVSPSATSHNDQLSHFMNAGAVWISSNAFGALTAKAAKALNYKGLVVGGSGSENVAFQDAAGLDFVGTLMSAPNYQFPIRDKSTWSPGYKLHMDATIANYGVNTGPISGAQSPKSTAIAADCLYAFAVAANKAKSLDGNAIQAAMSTLDIPASMTPSGNRIHPGSEHNFYQQDAIHIYVWKHDDKGWYTEDLAKNLTVINKAVAAVAKKVKAGDACTKLKAKTKNAKGKVLTCAKVKGKLKWN
jgi:ABC-type branched-subunit amino acid transport system substrate-binding protein